MRITGGHLGGHRYNPPLKNWPTRPTTDFSREAIFNILYNRYDLNDCDFLDLFGGTGSNSYEFLSRGGNSATFVEQYGKAISYVQEFSKKLDIQEQLQIYRGDVFKFIKTCKSKFDIIIADPPYDLKKLETLPSLVFEHELLKENGVLIIEHDKTFDLTVKEHFKEQRKYGSTLFSFYKH